MEKTRLFALLEDSHPNGIWYADGFNLEGGWQML